MLALPLTAQEGNGAKPAAPTTAKPAAGAGDLLVAPTRVIFEGNTRTTTVSLTNIGSAKATYRIAIVHQRMTETGAVQLLKDGEQVAGELFADSLVRFTPRQVTLEPRQGQTIRMQLRKPADLADGEYRSHLYIHALPPDRPAATNPDDAPPDGLAVRLTPVFGITIPVIVRQGQLTAQTTITEIVLLPPAPPKAPPQLSFRLNRSGARSTYGDLTVTLLPAGGKKETVVGRMNGIAVYTPNLSRAMLLPLNVPKGMALQNGRLKITYRAKREEGNAVLAEAVFELPAK